VIHILNAQIVQNMN